MKKKGLTPQSPRGTRTAPANGRAAKARMTETDVERCADALCAYQREMSADFARSEQRDWSRFYLCGQLSNVERTSIGRP